MLKMCTVKCTPFSIKAFVLAVLVLVVIPASLEIGNGTAMFPQNETSIFQNRQNPKHNVLQPTANISPDVQTNKSTRMKNNSQHSVPLKDRKKKQKLRSTGQARTDTEIQRKGRMSIHGQNMEDVLNVKRLKKRILNQLGAVDPLLCLPKALCGISSENHRKLATSTSTSSPLGPIVHMDNSNSIEEYLKILSSVVRNETKRARPWVRGESNDNDASSSEESNESMAQDDLEFYKEKAKIKKLMFEEDYDPEPNWWDILPPHKDYYRDPPPPSSSSDDDSSWTAISPFRISKSLSSFFGSFLPSISFGFGKAPDVFADDPFFQDFRRSFKGRSLSNGGDKRLTWWSGKGVGRQKRKESKKRFLRGNDKVDNENTNKGRGKKNQKWSPNEDLKSRTEDLGMIDDPAEKFQLAVEIGKQLDDPKECDLIFTGCPFTYLEVVKIVEESKTSNNIDAGQDAISIPAVKRNPKNDSKSASKLGPERLEIILKLDDSRVAQMKDRQKETIIRYGSTPSSSIPSPLPLDTNDVTELSRTNLAVAESMSYNSIEAGPGLPVPIPFEMRVTNSPLFPAVKTSKLKKGKRRKQWGWGTNKKPKSTTTTTTATTTAAPQYSSKDLQIPTKQPHSHTIRYKHLPTTINRPSHIINYHFHNTNTLPQLNHNNNVQPQQSLTLHSFSANGGKQEQNLSSAIPATTTPASVAREQLSPSAVVKPRRPKPGKGKKRRPVRRHKQRRNDKRKKGSEERIVIRVTGGQTGANPPNSVYNVIQSLPFLNSLQSNSHAQQPLGYPYAPNSANNFSPQFPMQAMPFTPGTTHQSVLLRPMLSQPLMQQGLLSYVWGKKK